MTQVLLGNKIMKKETNDELEDDGDFVDFLIDAG